jgi:hypothetical protein
MQALVSEGDKRIAANTGPGKNGGLSRAEMGTGRREARFE